MSSTSQKHKDFVAEPMGEKENTCVAGIGAKTSAKLAEEGFSKAFHILGQFLLLNKDEELFMTWLKDYDVKKNHAGATFTCLKEWCDSFL